MKILYGFIAFLLIVTSCVEETKKENFKVKLGKVPLTAKFESDTMNIWGGSLIKGKDNLYHMYYSRWPKKLGMAAWVTNSEIAHAVSKSAFGPFKYKETALPVRGAEFWDGLCTHNPTIHKFEEKYYLYYMGTTGDGIITSEPGKRKINWQHRNNQRIGVAIADNPNGPWKRFDKPLIDVSSDSLAIDALLVSNPSITKKPDGDYLMVYKAAGKKLKMPMQGPVVHSVASSKSPAGPFKKSDKPIFEAKESEFPAEDPFIWYQNEKYYAIVKDMHGAFTNAGKSLVLFESVNGYDWNLSKNPLVSTLEVEWENGEIQKLFHLERPQLYFENNKPIALLCAANTIDAHGVIHPFNIQIPLISRTGE